MKKNILALGKKLNKKQQQIINGGMRGIVPCNTIRDCFFLGDGYIGDYFCLDNGRGFKECVLL
ncbi:hypothetical protein [Tenacibaculum agarivorans]|uniref:hypothetical protein n=1 Tax=Tenacibaculum agarivorans TaxID=1908389 RepID=UPI00094BB46F|nr:hypothetical protein [Tenacibaculum agarivorans]